MKVKIEKKSHDELKKDGVFSWPIWTKEVSDFDWYYDTQEKFYLIEGEVDVELDDGSTVHFEAGDFVTFSKGVRCRWHVKKPVRKHYSFS
ncbi:MAG: cupin domain-containing protein [Spirochaetes bacterium]|nr:cupin domain-containing protein [Spirochaetota bacterium]